jgi:hypothetical protein
MKTVIEKRLKEPIPDYVSSLHSRLASKKGQIAAVESESGEYVIAPNLLKAAAAARARFPGKVFYFIRIGYPYVHRQTGRPAKRVSDSG